MLSKKIAVLGVSIGTRRIGIAILNGNELVEWKVTVFRGTWCPFKLTIIKQHFQKLYRRYGIKIVAIKVPNLMDSSPGLKTLIRELDKFFIAKGTQVCRYNITQLKAHCVPDKKSNKKALIQFVASKYPEVYMASKKEENNRNPHYGKMFEAIAAGELCLKEYHEAHGSE